jgi:hypothetical protein
MTAPFSLEIRIHTSQPAGCTKNSEEHRDVTQASNGSVESVTQSEEPSASSLTASLLDGLPRGHPPSIEHDEYSPKPELSERIFQLQKGNQWLGSDSRKWRYECDYSGETPVIRLCHEKLARKISLSFQPKVLWDNSMVRLDLLLVDDTISRSQHYVHASEQVSIIDIPTMVEKGTIDGDYGWATRLARQVARSRTNVLFDEVSVDGTSQTYINSGRDFKTAALCAMTWCFEKALTAVHGIIVESDHPSAKRTRLKIETEKTMQKWRQSQKKRRQRQSRVRWGGWTHWSLDEEIPSIYEDEEQSLETAST